MSDEKDYLARLATAELERQVQLGLDEGSLGLQPIDVPPPPPPVRGLQLSSKAAPSAPPTSVAASGSGPAREDPEDVERDIERKRAKVTLCPPLWLCVNSLEVPSG